MKSSETSTAPCVSLIIPCWNCEKYIASAIESALDQTYSNIEVLIINDGSTDNRAKIIKRYLDRTRTVEINNGGACKARNVGLNNARGSYVKFLDADDVITPDAIYSELMLIRSNPDSTLLPISSTQSTDESLNNRELYWSVPQKFLSDYGQINLDWILFNTPPVGSPLYSRQRLLDIGGFNEKLTNREDNDIFIRYIVNGAIPVYLNKVNYLYRQYIAHKRTSREALVRNSDSQLSFLESHVKLTTLIQDKKLRITFLHATAFRAWSWGRSLARVQAYEEANQHFNVAKQLMGPEFSLGSPLYKFINRFTGPILAERVLERLKSVVQPEAIRS